MGVSFYSPLERFLILCFTLLALILLLFYLIHSWERRAQRPLWYFAAGCLCAGFGYLNAIDRAYDLDMPYTGQLPWLITLLLAGFAIWLIRDDLLTEREQITRSSIKEGMDHLPLAGSFFRPDGTLKLCNLQMKRLCRTLTGTDLQLLSELRAGLEHCEQRGIHRTAEGGYRFPDGKVWFYTETPLTTRDGTHYLSAVFSDGTALDTANRQLEQDNDALAAVNSKLRKMYTRAEDRIREREYLAFKMKVHNDIGQSLTVVRQILQGTYTGDDIQRQLDTLTVAARTLIFSPRPDSDDPYDILLAEAHDVGIEIHLDGMLPLEPLIYELVVRAIRVCVSNCIRHAHGTAVYVRIRGTASGYSVRILNDGQKPRGKIVEGGGLSTLRSLIESAGGEMHLSSVPEFTLRLELSREEMDL